MTAANRYPFSGTPTFLRSGLCLDPDRLEADIAVMGVPFDEGSPFMPGSRFGTRSIREHSLRFHTTEGLYDLDGDRLFLQHELANGRIADVGDVNVIPTDSEGSFARATEMTGRILDRGALPVVIGGDHSITYPVVRAFKGPLHVVQFDAHDDYSPIRPGYAHTNSHAFRHISAMDHVQSLTQVGLRGLRLAKSRLDDSRADGNTIVGMTRFRELGPAGLAGLLPEGEACFVSIDIDVYDMSLVPGCVSGEPDGMTYLQLRDSLAALAQRMDIIGFDLVEVNPQLDVGTGATSYLAAYTIIELLTRICDQPRWKERRAK